MAKHGELRYLRRCVEPAVEVGDEPFGRCWWPGTAGCWAEDRNRAKGGYRTQRP
ncbi:hypothetical protein [Streptomyces sp. NPDC003996]